VLRAAGRLFCGLFSVVFPDDCRVCGQPLREISRIPVCAACLSEPQPLIAEYFCVSCRAPFLNAHPLDETGRCALCRLGLAGFDAVYSYGSYEGTQAGLTNAKRRANVSGAFAMRRGIRLDGARVLLVDDVLTTGASAAACARVLKRAGAAHVALLAVARTDRRTALADLPNAAGTTLALTAGGTNA
jgi:predicted amidophosphoribosyltransferase